MKCKTNIILLIFFFLYYSLFSGKEALAIVGKSKSNHGEKFC